MSVNVDPGTQFVVTDAFNIILDKDGSLSHFNAALFCRVLRP